MDAESPIENCKGMLQVDFANEFLGGGVLVGVSVRFGAQLINQGMCTRRDKIRGMP